MFDFFKMLENMPKYEEFEGQVFYDPKENRFLQLRGQKNDYLTFGRFTEYFSSAKTLLPTQQLSYEYTKKLIPITAVDKIKGVYYDGIGWRVPKKKLHEFDH